jgi:hypothetical protein
VSLDPRAPPAAAQRGVTSRGNLSDLAERPRPELIQYRWAEQYRITDMDECRGRSQFFYEGCLVYAEDPHRGAEEDDNGNPPAAWPEQLSAHAYPPNVGACAE